MKKHEHQLLNTHKHGVTYYRDPSTQICLRCPVANGGDDWRENDPRWQQLGQICDEATDSRIKYRKTKPTCLIALVYWYLGRYHHGAAQINDMLNRAERIAAQKLAPDRPESAAWFERALQVEADRLAFEARLEEHQNERMAA